MEKIENAKLENIYGGTSVSSALINAIVNVIKVLKDAGHSFGSGIRRISEDNLCPLD
jgi:hypothetical protein